MTDSTPSQRKTKNSLLRTAKNSCIIRRSFWPMATGPRLRSLLTCIVSNSSYLWFVVSVRWMRPLYSWPRLSVTCSVFARCCVARVDSGNLNALVYMHRKQLEVKHMLSLGYLRISVRYQSCSMKNTKQIFIYSLSLLCLRVDIFWIVQGLRNGLETEDVISEWPGQFNWHV